MKLQKTPHTASFAVVHGQRRPLLHINKIPNQNNEVTDLLAAIAAGNNFQLTERATLDLHDLLQNNIFDCEADFTDEQDYNNENIEVGFEPDECGASIRTLDDILHDMADLAAEPTAEELIAEYYRKRLFNPKAK